MRKQNKKRSPERFNNFLLGFLPGLFLPVLFAWVYIARFFPGSHSFFEVIRQLYPGVILGKILLLSIMPNLLGVFLFYKQDFFKTAIGIMVAALPYLLGAMFLL